MKKIRIIINNAIRKVPGGYTLADNGNQIVFDLIKLGANPILIGLVQHLNDYTIKNKIPQNVKIISLTVFKSHKNSCYKAINYIYEVFKLISICLSGNNFYVYIPSNTSLIALFLLRIFRKKYGLYIRGAIIHSRLIGKVRHYSFLYKFYINSIKKATFILVTGKYLYNELKSLNRNTEEVVPMMSVKKDDLIKKRKFSRTKNILFIGRIDKEKGIEELIEALRILNHNHVQFKLVLVGGGEESYIRHVENLINTNGLNQKIEMTGKINDFEILKKYYKNANIFILPSHHEGFPRVLYEAMTFGLPIITTDLEAYKGTLIHNTNCILVEIKNAQSLANSIVNLMKSTEKRKYISENALKFMEEFFENARLNTHASQVLEKFEMQTNNQQLK